MAAVVVPVEKGRFSVALVDGNESRRSELGHSLFLMGYEPVAFDGMAGLLRALRGERRFDLLLLSLEDGMVGIDLLETCKAQPTLLIAQDWQREALQAIDKNFWKSGAVDFIVSPPTGHELELRVRLLLRRTSLSAGQTGDSAYGNYHFLKRDNAVLHRGRRIQLTPREFDLALLLFSNPGRLLTREFLWSALWGESRGRDLRAINTCIVGIRKKLELCPEHGVVLRSVYREGYELRRLRVPGAPDQSGQ